MLNLSQVALPSHHLCLQLTIHLCHGGWCDMFMSLCYPRFCLGLNCRNIDWISFPLPLFSIVWVVYQTDEKFCSKSTWIADFTLHLRGSRDPEASSPGPSALEMLFFCEQFESYCWKMKTIFFLLSLSGFIQNCSQCTLPLCPKVTGLRKWRGFNDDGYSKLIIHLVTSSKLATALGKESWRDNILEKWAS